jgi:hypothetical protein
LCGHICERLQLSSCKSSERSAAIKQTKSECPRIIKNICTLPLTQHIRMYKCDLGKQQMGWVKFGGGGGSGGFLSFAKSPLLLFNFIFSPSLAAYNTHKSIHMSAAGGFCVFMSLTFNFCAQASPTFSLPRATYHSFCLANKIAAVFFSCPLSFSPFEHQR